MLRKTKRRTWRRLKIGIGAAAILSTVALMWLTGLASLRITLAEVETGARANLAVQTAVLERLLDKFRLLSPLLARGPDIGQLLMSTGRSGDPGIAAIAAGMSGAEEIWLMDRQGNVVVSSQDGVPTGSFGGASPIAASVPERVVEYSPPMLRGSRPLLILALAAFAGGAQGGCEVQEGPTPPSKPAADPSSGATPEAVPDAEPPRPLSQLVEAEADETSLEGLTQLTFGGRVDNPRAWAKGLAYLEHGSQACPKIVAIDLEGRPQKLPAAGARGAEFDVDAEGWVFSGPEPGSKDCGQGKGMRRLLASFDLARGPSAKQAQAVESAGFQGFPELDPSGKKLAYVGVTTDGDPELWLAARDGSHPRRLTFQAGLESRPRFSADGERLYFGASRPQGAAQHQAWSRFADDGSVAPLPSEIWELPLENGEARQLTRWGANSFAPVPYEGSVLFTSNAQDPAREDFDLDVADALREEHVERLPEPGVAMQAGFTGFGHGSSAFLASTMKHDFNRVARRSHAAWPVRT